jgi:hypothetical protein
VVHIIAVLGFAFGLAAGFAVCIVRALDGFAEAAGGTAVSI